jgi:hypothetical protein
VVQNSLSLLLSKLFTPKKDSKTILPVARVAAQPANNHGVTTVLPVNGKCLLLPAANVGRKLKYRSTQLPADPYTAAIASKQTDVTNREAGYPAFFC